MKSFENYFNRMGFPSMKLDKLNEVLKQAVRNSAQMKYHGGVEVSFPLKPADERAVQIIQEEGLLNYADSEESKNDDTIKQALFKRYPNIALAMSINKDLTPG